MDEQEDMTGLGLRVGWWGGGTGFVWNVDRWVVPVRLSATVLFVGFVRGLCWSLEDIRIPSWLKIRQKKLCNYNFIILNFIKGFDYVDTNIQFAFYKIN